MDRHMVKISRYLSLVLRHRPKAAGIELDGSGWTDVEPLIAAVGRKFPGFDLALLDRIVAENDKRRFSFNEEKTRIRANQGHSLPVDLGLVPRTPPEYLYHGTVARFMTGILAKGLIPRGRHHVHLSPDPDTARSVGRRRGEPVVLEIQAGRMTEAGHAFFESENGVWLTDRVPPSFIKRLQEPS